MQIEELPNKARDISFLTTHDEVGSDWFKDMQLQATQWFAKFLEPDE